MALLRLAPSFKDYLWGGHRLVDEYNKQYNGEILAESWELSCHPDGPSTIANGPYAGKTFQEYIRAVGEEVLGENCRRFREFPILIKFIDARDNLSIQVHPDNRYALKNEGQYGKTEMWYVMDAKPGAYLYYGFRTEISKEEFARRIEENTLLEVLNAVPVQKGDVLFIESGTIHAIGKDILIAEIQQNSNVTYRVYDYGRVGKDGRKRDLHIEQAIAVTNRVPIIKSKSSYPHIADCDYFTVDKLNLDGVMMNRMQGEVTKKSFVSILILDGEGTITCGKEMLPYQKGDSLFLTAGSGEYSIQGSCDALVTTIREKAGPVRVGIHIGSSTTRIGLVDIHQQILDFVQIPTRSEDGSDAVIKRASQTALQLLEDRKIQMDQCVGVGVAVPGTVDWKSGTVCYSNNIHWENVPLADEMSKYFPLPVRIANDADCAALGESVAGAGKDYQDVIMVTLGRGVGGGIILDGNIFEGSGMGGSELGHMAIATDGELCTCGRKGCLEAYVSAPALMRAASRVYHRDVSCEDVFRMSAEGDRQAVGIVNDYIHYLGTGLVNMVNIFRPQLILLGSIPTGAEDLLPPLRKMLQEECFGGAHGEIPVLAAAALGKQAAVIGAASLI